MGYKVSDDKPQKKKPGSEQPDTPVSSSNDIDTFRDTETVRRFAGGVAHAVNNVLTAIEGYAELVASEDEWGVGPQEAGRSILAAVNEAKRLMDRVLLYAGRRNAKRRAVSVYDVITSMKETLSGAVGKNAALRFDLDRDAGVVSAERSLVEDLLLILVDNAGDATVGGGTVAVSLREVAADEFVHGRHTDPTARRFVEIEVRDTGTGIEERYLSHVFEPFFTLKAVGKGVGMGLAAAYGIVAAFKGDISIAAAPGVGTTVTVRLPVVREAVADSAPAPPASENASVTERGSVLIVEDEEAVRRMFAAVLRKEGYNVTEARDGLEAIEAAQKQGPQTFDVLVTDVIMPRLRGTSLARQLLQSNVDLRVIYMSGYTAPEFRALDLEGDNVAFLQKPFSGADLVRQIREIMSDQNEE